MPEVPESLRLGPRLMHRWMSARLLALHYSKRNGQPAMRKMQWNLQNVQWAYRRQLYRMRGSRYKGEWRQVQRDVVYSTLKFHFRRDVCGGMSARLLRKYESNDLHVMRKGLLELHQRLAVFGMWGRNVFNVGKLLRCMSEWLLSKRNGMSRVPVKLHFLFGEWTGGNRLHCLYLRF